ncbi:DUF4382 domain-containing protein [Winogradskyella maritima]|uniref:DUF4382 domain-containing protein n=1 Tax=Winogradskyella maritima TaxID=1517766 RepID=A0ABV8AI71_9FLAO|nr:DUF4382 domain-containing protein [Winogradskyella maritima]
MKFLKSFKLLGLLVLALIFASCNDNDNPSNDTANISVKLVDEPGDYDNVFVEVVDVLVKYDNADDDAQEDMDQDGDVDEDDAGWVSLNAINTGVYDLLELTGGVSLDLVNDEEIEAGFIKDIRLVLGDDNTVVIDGETFPLNTPSAQQSGLKVKVDQAIEGGFNYDFILDFDVDRSIVMAGNSGNINLKPVLRASLEINSGTLAGSITNDDVAVVITVSDGVDDIATTTIDDMGNFEVPGLSPGIYTVSVTPEVPAEGEEGPVYLEVVLTDVEIEVGTVTTLEAITLVE